MCICFLSYVDTFLLIWWKPLAFCTHQAKQRSAETKLKLNLKLKLTASVVKKFIIEKKSVSQGLWIYSIALFIFKYLIHDLPYLCWIFDCLSIIHGYTIFCKSNFHKNRQANGKFIRKYFVMLDNIFCYSFGIMRCITVTVICTKFCIYYIYVVSASVIWRYRARAIK